MTPPSAPNSLRALLGAYLALRGAERAFAVASIVRVEGSAFRREGARLLVVPSASTDFSAFTSEPHTWGGVPRPETLGSISGGCLEAEVAAHALDVLRTGQSRVVALASRLGRADRAGFGLGCGGTVHVLIQPVLPGREGPLDAVVRALQKRRVGALASVIRGSARSVGGHLFVEPDGRGLGSLEGDALRAQVTRETLERIEARVGGEVRVRTADGEDLDIRIDVVLPSLHLVVCGTGPDARAMVRQGATLGWETTAVGASSVPEVAADVPEADHPVVVTDGLHLLHRVCLDAWTAAVVMTHNFERDRALVGALVASPTPFVGLLGSRRRTAALLAELEGSGEGPEPGRLHSPVGLDLGAETPEEIALATCAQILACLRGVASTADGGFPDRSPLRVSGVWPDVAS